MTNYENLSEITGTREPVETESVKMLLGKIYDELHELEEYKAIGTVEECRESVSKSKKMKAKPFCKYAEDIKICPRCEDSLIIYKQEYCHRCGQAILWENGNG